MKCSCGSLIVDGEKACSSCGRRMHSKNDDNKQTGFWGTCCACNDSKAKGRNTSGKGERPEYYCYHCWSERSNKKFNWSDDNTYATKEEAAYARALLNHVQIPNFYLEEPNWKELALAHDKVLNLYNMDSK